MKSQRPINTQRNTSHNSAKQHSQNFTYWSYQLQDIKQLYEIEDNELGGKICEINNEKRK